MCESCSPDDFNRRDFLTAGGALAATGTLAALAADGMAAENQAPASPTEKEPARVTVAFLYPPANVVYEGKNEDSWRGQRWFTWPGNQFLPEEQERKFTEKIREMASALGVKVEFSPRSIYQKAKVDEFIERAKADRPDAVLIVNFWNTFSKWAAQMATQSAPTAIVYHPVGSNHQLPPGELMKAEGIYYIHSIENWAEIERGLRAVRAMKMLPQSRLLRVGGGAGGSQGREERLGVDIACAPAKEFNDLFDATVADDAVVREAMEIKKRASRVMDVTDEYFVDALRAHRAVGQMMRRYEADAITITCLHLKHRKPCVSFAINNGELIPCGCENALEGTLTQMLGRWLLDRAGFMHNPEFDTSENRYFASHCTCAWKLHGPDQPPQNFWVRPFFHQLPKTPALDVQWTPGDPALLVKYLSGKSGALVCWSGKVIESPTCPPVGGCATRVLMEIDKVDDVCRVYPGPHPILFCGDQGDARRFKAFARMNRLDFKGNV